MDAVQANARKHARLRKAAGAPAARPDVREAPRGRVRVGARPRGLRSNAVLICPCYRAIVIVPKDRALSPSDARKATRQRNPAHGREKPARTVLVSGAAYEIAREREPA